VTPLDQLWYGDGVAMGLMRSALTPAALLFGAVVRLRGALYDSGMLRAHVPPIPVLSVGNVSVGGTGKTPITSWAAATLRAAGARPAIVLRGYGGDETLVHATLNPELPLVVDADRVRGVHTAHALGADCAILDDAFQHRRLARTADWVLVSAERHGVARRLLPAGPLREPLSALARAQLVIVTRKSATIENAHSVADQLQALLPRIGVVICLLAPDGLVDARDGSVLVLDRLRGARVVAIAAVGAPTAFFDQLRAAGTAELRTVVRRDHHHFTRHDVEELARRGAGAEAVVCTLKDAVKLAPLWPRDALPLWYVSQRVEIERGRELIDASFAMILSARANSSTAGAAG
jgi:tetraacyldisaccharide 4'-kinase